MIQLKAGMSGEYRCFLYDNEQDMNVIVDTGWHPNLIVNIGLDQYHTGNPFQRTYIGSGSTPAVVTQVQMDTFEAESAIPGISDGVLSGNASAPDYEFSQIKSRRFAAGVGTTTIQEIAMGGSADNSGTLIFNRVVIAPIVKGATQVLDVLFRVTLWPPVIDVIGTVGTASTVDGVPYETITRCLNLDDNNGSTVYSSINPIGGASSFKAFDGNLGSITDVNPLGNQDNGDGGAGSDTGTYTPGDNFFDLNFDVGLDGWVLPSELIRTLRGAVRHFTFQTQFGEDPDATGPAIPKTASDIMDFTWRISWDRKP